MLYKILIIFFNLIIFGKGWNLVNLKKNNSKKIFYKKDKFISVSSFGVDAFYNLGICSYIKTNYNISNYKFISTSLGTWNILFLSCKYPINDVVDQFLGTLNFNKINSVSSLNQAFKIFFLNYYNINDFDKDKINICLPELNSLAFESNIISEFKNLEQILDCCLVSSNLDYLSKEGLLKIYDDCDFNENYPPNNIYCHLDIKSNIFEYDIFTSLFIRNLKYESNDIVLKHLYNKGIYDSVCNKDALDYIFNNNEFINYNDNKQFFLNSPYDINF